MATIKTYETSRGVRHCAEIVIRKNSVTLHRESKSFKQRRDAVKWSDNREAELKVNGIPSKAKDYTLEALIDKYITEFGDNVRMGRTKLSDLQKIKTFEIARRNASTLTSADYISHIKARLDTGILPQTAKNDMIWIAIILKFGIAACNLKASLDPISSAKDFLASNGMIARPDSRDRIPTVDEHTRLMGYFNAQQQRRSGVPILDILLFAMHSARRQSEITRIRWEDNDDEHHTGIVRDMKHPRKKAGNNRTFNYTPEAWAIAQRQPTDQPEIFPYNNKTIGAYFTRACSVLEIKNLHFHDYRHLATTKLFVDGLSIQEVSAVTLHESWNMLKRYTHLDEKTKALVRRIYELPTP